MTICVKKANYRDLKSIFGILNNCKMLLNESGSPQWSGEDAPTKVSIIEEFKKKTLYIFEVDGRTLGTAILTRELESAYSKIMYGSWENKENAYYSIHRFAIEPSEGGKGYAKLFMSILIAIAKENKVKDLRIDTHPLNKSMKKVILANGFEFKGIVNLPIANGERYAYQKND